MAIIRTLEGEYYEMPDEILQKYPRACGSSSQACQSSKRSSIRLDVSKEF